MEFEKITELSKEIAKYLSGSLATKIDVLDIRKKSNQIKIMILSTCENTETVRFLSGMLLEFIKGLGLTLLRSDGTLKSEWVILDFEDIVVHIFTPELRSKYNLEKIWKDNKNQITWNGI